MSLTISNGKEYTFRYDSGNNKIYTPVYFGGSNRVGNYSFNIRENIVIFILILL